MARLLLLSNSTTFGRGYLDHAEAEIRALLAGVSRLLFVPDALHDRAGYAAKVRERFEKLGVAVDSTHESPNGMNPVRAVEQAQAVFIGGGNTFRLLNAMYSQRLLEPLRARVQAGMPYLGASAGTNVATRSIQTTNDMPIVAPPSFAALALVPFNVNPHYLDPAPDSTHMGETREQRLQEFHEMNDAPVVGLRDGTWLEVGEKSCRLGGLLHSRLFRKGVAPEEFPPGSDLGFLLR
jgi:dipeptidase E